MNYPLVLIEWVDSCSPNGWTDNPPRTEPLGCRTVGWLVHDGDKVKTVAGTVSMEDDPQRHGEMAIPTVAVTRIVRLSEPGKRVEVKRGRRKRGA